MTAITGFAIILALLLFVGSVRPQCTHPIFCSETILKAIAASNFFTDNKSFVDLVLKVPTSTALNYFRTKGILQFIQLSFHPDLDLIL
jgi:hypothetical protein